MRPTLLAAVVVLTLPAPGTAQVERYELGRRVKRFEAEWERQPDPAARKRALAVLPKASTQFLSLNLAEAARTVDDAYWALKQAEPPAAGVRWLDALCVEPRRRAIDRQDPSYLLTVRQLYKVEGGPPAGATARLVSPYGLTTAVSLAKLPVQTDLSTAPLPGGAAADDPDGLITLELRAGEVELRHTAGVSRVSAGKPAGADRTTIEAATTAATRELTDRLRAGEVPETDLPVARWLDTADWDPRLYAADGSAGLWAMVPTGKDAATPCRLFEPPGLDRTKPTPLVVALHGAGGSENMFFESYGAGHIVKECHQRGWLLVSPRSGLLGTPPVAAIIDKLSERYPIDPKRVFLVGHSMGAGQAVELVQRHPGRFAAVASLAGAGRVRQPERFADLPVFVGVGTADFALKSSRSLVKALEVAGAKRVTAKEYPDLEHLVIVREALPDVFRLFDAVR